MIPSAPEPFDVVVVGAGPAGVVAALRAARLGARTALITRDQFGGMAANERAGAGAHPRPGSAADP